MKKLSNSMLLVVTTIAVLGFFSCMCWMAFYHPRAVVWAMVPVALAGIYCLIMAIYYLLKANP
jgi:protein-S-isoprenylcysteine O-methyltransferase Ste14